MTKIYGVFVGSFNPPTKAHLEIGELILQKGIVNKIIYVPCNSVNKKNILLDINIRYKMLLTYLKKNPNFIISSMEIENCRANFNYQNMALLRKKYLGIIYIIIGSDHLVVLDKWDNYEYLLQEYFFIVVSRYNINCQKIINQKFFNYRNKFIILDYQNNISSSRVRENIKNKELLKTLLTDDIFNYINENNLYN